MTDEDGFWPVSKFVPEPIESEIGVVPDTGYNPFNFSTEGDYLLFRFTAETFTQVLSALRNGAFMTYGQEGERVYWEFLRNVDYPIMICASIIECLLNDADTQSAIASLLATNETIREALRGVIESDPVITEYLRGLSGQVATDVLSSDKLNQNLLKEDACDPGYTFNQASVFVNLLDSLTSDMFEAVEVGTNPLERVQLLVSGVPGVGIMPGDELIGLADQLIENVKEEYEGAMDEGMRDDLRCGLWCQIKDECEMSIEDAFAFYEAKLGQALPSNPIDGMLAILQFVGNGDFPGDSVVYAMHLLVLAAMRAGGDYLGIDFTRLSLRILAAGNNADNDYGIICEECVEDSDCVSITHDVSINPFAPGWFTGLLARAGDTVDIHVSGNWIDNNGNPVDETGLQAFSPNAAYLAGTDVHIVTAMAQIEGDAHWTEISSHGTFTASRDGRVMANVNGFPSQADYNAFTGAMDWDVCVRAGSTLQIVPTYPTIWNNPIEFIGYDVDGLEVWTVESVSGAGDGRPTINVHDATNRVWEIVSYTMDSGSPDGYQSLNSTGSFISASSGVPVSTEETPIKFGIWGQYSVATAATFRIHIKPS